MIITEADFNIITIFICYKINIKDDVYNKLLKSDWFNGQLHSIMKQNFNIKGCKMSLCRNGIFSTRHRIVLWIPYKDDKIKLIFKTDKVIVKYKKNKKVFAELYETNRILFEDIKVFLLSVSD